MKVLARPAYVRDASTYPMMSAEYPYDLATQQGRLGLWVHAKRYADMPSDLGRYTLLVRAA